MPDETNATGYNLSDTDRLIHEPARYNIMALLYVVEQAEFLFIQNQLGLTPGNLSSHISKLDEGGFLAVEKTYAGKTPKTFLKLTGSGRAAFDSYREKMISVLMSSPPNTVDNP
jgi:DNA-binding MarR family transcriptional regulator